MTKIEKQKLRKAIGLINGTSEDDEGHYDEGMVFFTSFSLEGLFQ